MYPKLLYCDESYGNDRYSVYICCGGILLLIIFFKTFDFGKKENLYLIDYVDIGIQFFLCFLNLLYFFLSITGFINGTLKRKENY